MYRFFAAMIICGLYLHPLSAQSSFTNVTQSAGIDHMSNNGMGGGSAWFDYDLDGDEDIVMVGGIGNNRLYRNNGDGTFTDVSQAAGFILPAS
ncbi:MAG: hypothetical protein DRI69_12050, partial [Bacteroidetes bacterium]